MEAKVEGLPEKYNGYGFKDMIEIPENRKFIELGKKYIRGNSEKKSLVFIGNIGSGKTRLAVAILKNLIPVKSKMLLRVSINDYGVRDEKYAEYYRGSRSRFIIADEYFQAMNDAAINRKSKMEIITELFSYDVLCLDDLGIENFSAAKQENLYLLINRAYVENKPIFLTSNFDMTELQKIDPRITDRLKEMAAIMKFEGKSFRK